MARATEATLNELHEEIGKTLISEIRKYKDGAYTDKDGCPIPVPAALLSTARSYLNDNQINRPDEEEPDPEDSLSNELPDFED